MSILLLYEKMQNEASKSERKRNGSDINPGHIDTKRVKSIQTSDREGCYKAVKEILSRTFQDDDTEEDIIIDHKGTETIDELIQELFETPSGNTVDVDEIRKLINSSQENTDGSSTPVHNVVIAQYKSDYNKEKESGHQREPTGSEKEDLFKTLFEKLKEVEGFDNEPWGSTISNEGVLHYCTDGDSTKENEESFLGFLEDEKLEANNGSTGPGNSNGHQFETSSANDNIEDHINGDVNVSGLNEISGENSYSNEAINGEEFSEDISGSYEGAFNSSWYNADNLAGIDISKLPPEAITDLFVLEHVLASVPSEANDNTTSLVAPINDSTPPLENAVKDGTPSLEAAINDNTSTLNNEFLEDSEDDVQPETCVSPSGSSVTEVLPYSQKKFTVTDPAKTDNNSTPAPSSSSSIIEIYCKKPASFETPASIASTCSSVRPCSVVLSRIDDDELAKGSSSGIYMTYSPETASVKLKNQIRDKFYAWRKQRLEAKKTVSGSAEVNKSTDNKTPTEKLETKTNLSDSSAEVLETTDLQHESYKSTQVNIKELNSTKQSGTDDTANKTDNDDENDFTTSFEKEVEETPLQPEAEPNNVEAKSLISTEPSESSRNEAAPQDGMGRRARHSGASPTPSSRTKNSSQESVSTSKLKKSKIPPERFMKNEMRKDSPDMSLLSDAMEKSFVRRKQILEDANTGPSSLLIQYPALSLYIMLKEEYGRIVGSGQKMQQLEDTLQANFDTVLNPKKCSPGSVAKRHALLQACFKRWEANPNCSHLTKKVLGMLALCFHLAETTVVKKLCKFEKNGNLDSSKIATPTIVLKESEIFNSDAEMWIYVEGEKYLKVPNFYEAVLCVYATYYLFDIQYEKSLQALFDYFDMLVGNAQSTYKKGFGVNR